MKKRIILICLMAILFSPIPFSYALVNHLLISEVFYDAVSIDTDKEWVELYNPTDDDVNLDLGNWNLQHQSGSPFDLSGMILSQSYFVIAQDEDVFLGLYGFSPNFGGMGFSLGNSGDFLKLRKNNTVVVDAVGWEGGANGQFNSWLISANPGESIRRSSVQVDTDSPNDWISNAPPTPGQGPLSLPPPPPPQQPVPEPASLVLLGTGLLMGAFGKKYFRQTRIHAN